MRVLDDRVVSERCSIGENERYRLSVPIGWAQLAQMPVMSSGRDNAIRLRVHEDEHHHPIPHPQRFRMLAKGKQKILRQSPIQEHTDLLVDAENLQIGELPHHGERDVGSGDQPVFGISVDEHIQLVPLGKIARDVTARKEDFAELSGIEVEPRLRLADDRKKIAFAESCHAGKS